MSHFNAGCGHTFVLTNRRDLCVYICACVCMRMRACACVRVCSYAVWSCTQAPTPDGPLHGDDDDWLNMSPTQLDEMLSQRYGQPFAGADKKDDGDVSDPKAASDELQNMVGSINGTCTDLSSWHYCRFDCHLLVLHVCTIVTRAALGTIDC